MEEKYWIIVEGQPQGPFTGQELKKRRDFAAGLPVWNQNYTDWTTAGEVEELALLLAEVEAEEAAAIAEEDPQPVGGYVEQNVEGANRSFTGWVNPAKKDSRDENKPLSYVGWNILMTICCCLPIGIIGIIYGSMVNPKWMMGDEKGAQKASNAAAWCLILSIVLGLIAIPFQMLYTLI